MIPAPEFIGAGRANRNGTAYLYASTDRETAIAEVRPWVGEYVTVAQFTNTRELRLIDFANDLRDGIRIYFKEPQPSEWEEIVWSDINSAFSRPIGRDSSAEYVPTQIIADHIRVNGFDGIVYRSSLGAGGNCCLFDLETVMIKSRHLHHVRAVKYDAPEDGPPE